MKEQYEKMKQQWHSSDPKSIKENKEEDQEQDSTSQLKQEYEALYNQKVQELEENSLQVRQGYEAKYNEKVEEMEQSYARATQDFETRLNELSQQLTQYQTQNQDLEEQNSRLKHQLQEISTNEGQTTGTAAGIVRFLRIILKLNWNNQNIEEYENTIKELKEKLRQADERGSDHTAFIREADLRVQEVNEQIEDAENRVKKAEKHSQDLERKLKELKSSHEHELSLKDRRVEDLQMTIKRLEGQMQEREQKVEDLESLSRSYTSEIEALKRVSKANAHDEDEIRSLKEEIAILQRQNKSLEESYKKRIEELSKQNSELKRELENAKSILSTKDIENENTVAKIGLENDKLKKQVKELNAKILTMQYEGNEVVHLRERIDELKNRNDNIDNELSQAKVCKKIFSSNNKNKIIDENDKFGSREGKFRKMFPRQ